LRYKFNNNASRCQGPRFFNWYKWL
jgi:hypothetical protein